MEKSWVMMKDWTDKEHKEQEEVCFCVFVYDIFLRCCYLYTKQRCLFVSCQREISDALVSFICHLSSNVKSQTDQLVSTLR